MNEKRKLVDEIRESFGLDIRENYITNRFESYKISFQVFQDGL